MTCQTVLSFTPFFPGTKCNYEIDNCRENVTTGGKLKTLRSAAYGFDNFLTISMLMCHVTHNVCKYILKSFSLGASILREFLV